jgi:hypothetical protein
MPLHFSGDDIRIVTAAISWQLNVPYEHTAPPNLSEADRQALRILFNELCFQQRVIQFGATSILVEVGEIYSCADGRMQLPPAYHRLMTRAVVSFVEELKNSTSELEIITGLPVSATFGLLARIDAV